MPVLRVIACLGLLLAALAHVCAAQPVPGETPPADAPEQKARGEQAELPPAPAADEEALRRAPQSETPSAGPRRGVLAIVEGLLCSCLSFLAIIGLLYYLGGRFLWLPWLWPVALAQAVFEWIDSAWARVASRRALQREMEARLANPRDSLARYNLGIIYMRQRRFDLAAEELAESVAINPDRADAQWRLGVCLMRLGRFEEAIAPLEACVARRPDHAYGQAQLDLAECYLRLERNADAARVLREHLKRHPNDAQSHFGLATVAERAGDREQAIAELREVLACAQRSPRLHRRRDRKLAAQARRKLREWGMR